MDDVLKLLDEWGKWSRDKFGDEDNPLPSLHHLKSEVDEAIADPTDDMEYADMLGLIMSAYSRTVGTATKLIETLKKKLEINKNRKWSEPDENGACYHID